METPSVIDIVVMHFCQYCLKYSVFPRKYQVLFGIIYGLRFFRSRTIHTFFKNCFIFPHRLFNICPRKSCKIRPSGGHPEAQYNKTLSPLFSFSFLSLFSLNKQNAWPRPCVLFVWYILQQTHRCPAVLCYMSTRIHKMGEQ